MYYPKALNKQAFERDKWTCQYCGKGVCENTARVDHIIALSIGGPHEIENFRTACTTCNAKKGKRDVEWLRRYVAFTKTELAGIITINQLDAMEKMGVMRYPLPNVVFYFESSAVDWSGEIACRPRA